MKPTCRRIRARVSGKTLELLEDREHQEVTVLIEEEVRKPEVIERVLLESAGVWSDEAHQGAQTSEDTVALVRSLRTGFERGYGS